MVLIFSAPIGRAASFANCMSKAVGQVKGCSLQGLITSRKTAIICGHLITGLHHFAQCFVCVHFVYVRGSMAALDLHKERGKSGLACISKLFLFQSIPSDKRYLSSQATSSFLPNQQLFSLKWQTPVCVIGKQSSLQRTGSPLSNGQAVLSPVDKHSPLQSPEHVQNASGLQ